MNSTPNENATKYQTMKKAPLSKTCKLRWIYDKEQIHDNIDTHLKEITPNLKTEKNLLYKIVEELLNIIEHSYNSKGIQQIIEKFRNKNIDDEPEAGFVFGLFLGLYNRYYVSCIIEEQKNLDELLTEAYYNLKCQRTILRIYGIPQQNI
jgi:hypothetical protein